MAKSKSVVVIDGHPDPDPAHFCHALALSYCKGARHAGHKVSLISLADLDFPLLRSPKAFAEDPTPDSLIPARDTLLAADHVTIIFPLWLGSMPALLKGFLEQVLHRDTAFEDTAENAFPKGKLKGKSARIITTMGMPGLVYRLWFLSHGLKALERNILKFIGFSPVRDTVFGMVEMVSDDKRKRWLAKVEDLGKQAI
ncbi:NAD(P)H-dependent oxidoreductase [Roseibium sp.]|uniref:NAD(P)H-dependent oxidoreductase n=1 Tax=Roseibium sp. TaxID=1936156 RepID=UPI003A96F49E